MERKKSPVEWNPWSALNSCLRELAWSQAKFCRSSPGCWVRGFEYVFHATTAARKSPAKAPGFCHRWTWASPKQQQQERQIERALEIGKLRCFCVLRTNRVTRSRWILSCEFTTPTFLLSHSTVASSQEPFIINYNHPHSSFTAKHFHVGKTWNPHCG